MLERHSSTVGHIDVTCSACGQEIAVDVRADVEPGVVDGAVAVGLRADTTHLCPGPDGGERIAS